jgi:hypothetical protein
MKEETLNHINLLYSSDAFITRIKRIEAKTDPIIIIGLGGTGIDALVYIKHLISKSFKRDSENKIPKNIAFLGIDTSVEALAKKHEGIGLTSAELYVCKDDVKGLLTNRNTMTDPMREFVHPHLTADLSAGTGAGGKRQCGRLMLFNNIAGIGNKVQEITHRVITGNDKPPLVYILSGIGGGTGSGTFLDVAFFVRGIIQKEITSWTSPTVFGYIFLPDVNATAKDISSQQIIEYIKKNGYAALKELDYLMGIVKRGETFNQEYSGTYDFSVPMNPFSYVQLISSKNPNSIAVPNGYDYAMTVVAESIVDYISGGELAVGNQGQALDAHYSNIDTINEGVEGKENKKFPGNCRYIALGSSAMRLPTEEIMMYLASLIFNKMDGMFANKPTEAQVDAMADALEINVPRLKARLQASIQNTLRDDKNTSQYSYDRVIKTGVTNIESTLRNGYFPNASRRIQDNYHSFVSAFSDLLDLKFRDVFTDPARGPIFANRMIADAHGLLNKLEMFKNDAQAQINKAEGGGIEQRRAEANALLEEARNPGFLATQKAKDAKKNAYIDAVIRVYELMVEVESLKKMLDVYTEVESRIRKKNSAVYDVVTEILENLKAIFRRNEDIVLKTSEVKAAGSKTYYWNVVDVPALAPEIREYVNEVDTAALISSFTNRLLDEMDSWISDKVNVVGFIQDFLETEFSGIVQLSLEEVIRRQAKSEADGKINPHILRDNSDDEVDIEKYVRENIARKLLDMSKALFPIVSGEGFEADEAIMISVPGDPACQSIYNALSKDTSWAGDHKKVAIKKSVQNDRITVTNCTCGLPLYRYTELKGYEEDYWKFANEPDGYGRHLRQNANEDWIDLPSPIPQQFWGVLSYYNKDIARINEENAATFEQALQEDPARPDRAPGYPIIVRDPNASMGHPAYQCRITTDEFNPKLLVTQSGVYDGTAIDVSKANQVLAQLKSIMQDGLELARDQQTNAPIVRTLIESTDVEKARISFLRTFDLIKLVEKEIPKYRQIQETIDELEHALQEKGKEREAYRKFAQVLYANTLSLNPETEVYGFDTDGDGKNVIELLSIAEASGHPEYSLYLKTAEMHDHQQKRMHERTAEILTELRKSGRSTLIEQVRATLARLEKNKRRISANQHVVADATTILLFYDIGIYEVTNYLDSLESI